MMDGNRLIMHAKSTDTKNVDENGFFPENLANSSFFASLNIGLALIDSQQNIIHVNPIFGRMVGLSTSLLLGKNLTFLTKFIQPAITIKKTELDKFNIHTITKPNFSKKNIMICVTPVLHSGQNTGFFAVQMIGFSEAMDFSMEQQSKINLLNGKIAELTQKNQQLEKQVLTDHLTGLHNKKSFTIQLSKEIERVNRFYANGLSLLLIDVDFFKKYNDTFGHLEGDKALQVIASSIQNNSRSYDLVSRYGGEEFAVILPNTNIRDAFFVAERIRHRVERVLFLGKKLTVSIGIGFWDKNMTEEDLIHDADLALYSAKKLGRNTVFPKFKVKKL